MSLHMTASQTVGPFLHIGMDGLNNDNLAADGVTGERIGITGHLYDGDGKPVSDGVIEIWQANAHGRYAHPEDTRPLPLEPDFTGFGRIPTNDDGRFSFMTVKPGSVPGPDGKPQAPHIVVSVFARGLINRLVTRIYFPDEPANADDPVLALVPAARRETLIARHVDGSDGALEWNILIQGDWHDQGETVFFDV